jgi:hypothetical protein
MKQLAVLVALVIMAVQPCKVFLGGLRFATSTRTLMDFFEDWLSGFSWKLIFVKDTSNKQRTTSE